MTKTTTTPAPFVVTAEVLGQLGACAMGQRMFRGKFPKGIKLDEKGLNAWLTSNKDVIPGWTAQWLTNRVSAMPKVKTERDMRKTPDPRKTAIRAAEKEAYATLRKARKDLYRASSELHAAENRISLMADRAITKVDKELARKANKGKALSPATVAKAIQREVARRQARGY